MVWPFQSLRFLLEHAMWETFLKFWHLLFAQWLCACSCVIFICPIKPVNSYISQLKVTICSFSVIPNIKNCIKECERAVGHYSDRKKCIADALFLSSSWASCFTTVLGKHIRLKNWWASWPGRNWSRATFRVQNFKCSNLPKRSDVWPWPSSHGLGLGLSLSCIQSLYRRQWTILCWFTCPQMKSGDRQTLVGSF